MDVSKPDHGAFDIKSRLNPTERLAFDVDMSASQPLQNGHHYHDSTLQSATSLNTSAHDTNAHINTQNVEPATTNGNTFANSNVNATQLSDELSSSLHNSGGTGDNLLPSSSQSAPDELDQSAPSAVDVDDNPLDTMPAVVQQPVSELRKETQPASSAPRAEIGEQKHQQDLIDDLALANGLSAKETDPISSTSELDPNLESQAKISALSALQESGADSTVSSDHSVAPSFNPDHAFSSALTSEPVSIPSVDHPDHPQVPVVEGSAAEAPLDPAPSPTEPSAPTLEKEFQSKDQLMQDIPQDSAKVAREREEDNSDEEPAAKRSKTEGTVSTDFKVPELPALNTQLNGTQMELPQPSDSPMTQSQHKYCLRIIQNVKRIQSSIAFRTPVDYVALKIPSYPSIIKRPMDLKTLEENLKGEKFPTVEAFIADFNQIVQNCETFNGRESAFTKAAYEMKASFDRNLVKMPGPDVAEASPAEKKKKKTVVPSTAKSAAPRRESRSSLPGSARSPISAGSPQTFALGPQGVPLIRRDSTLGDGRPKREIHPPAPRDLPYANQKPRKKKFQWELKFCEKVLNEISKPRYSQESWPFMAPVDPVALNIPSYHSIIKKPMDFGTMRTKLDHGEYENAKEFEADARLVFQNCYKFNPPSDVINQAGHKFENTFDHEWAKKREWIEANAPSSGPHSAGSSEAEDSDEEEEEDEVEEEEQTQLSKLQQQIAAMSRQVELITQKKKSPPVSGKKTMKGAKSVRKDTKKSAAPSKVEKKGHTRPAKKEKTPYVTYEQKQDISNRINSLSESKMATALKIIRDNMPTLKGVQDDELELDIDELSDEVLHKLLVFVRKHAPRADDSPARPAPAVSSAAPTRKKNKPMSKTEQEARIAQVQSGLSAFQNSGSAVTYEDIAAAQESSEGEDSSESEEE